MLALIIFLLGFNPSFASIEGWQKINEKEGIQVFKELTPTSDLVGVRGEAIIDAPIGKVIHVLIDNDHRKDWVDRLVVTKMIDKPSAYEQVMYQEFSAPWPVSNRDFVFWGRMTKDEKTGKIHLKFHSIEHKDAPKTPGVRADLKRGVYIVTPLSKNKTKLEVELLSDPKGLIPAWIVNLVQRSWPYKTIAGIRDQVKKPFVQDLDLFSADMRKKIDEYMKEPNSKTRY